MINRRELAFSAVGAALLAVPLMSTARAASEVPFSDEALRKAQAAGRPVLVKVHATWCPTCKAQDPIVSELTAQPKFRDLAVFRIDFDSQKDALKRLGVRSQSTLIVFKGAMEMGRSVGDTQRASIASLIEKGL